MTKPIRNSLAAFLAFSAAACSSAPPVAMFRVAFHISADDHSPVLGACLTAQGRALGGTDDKGVLSVNLQGVDGDSLAVKLQCPDGYVAPEHLSRLKLAKTERIAGGANSGIPYEATCTRKVRNIVVVAHVPNTPGIQVNVQGHPAAVTDAQGDAHILLPIDVGVRSMQVGFDTSSRPELVPKNPSRSFDVASGDDVLAVEQEFAVAAKPAARRSAPAAPRHIPVRLE